MSLNHLIQSSPSEWIPIGCSSLMVTGTSSFLGQPYIEMTAPSSVIPASTNTNIIFNTTILSKGNIGYNNGTFTINSNGVYQINYGISWATPGTGCNEISYINIGGTNYGYSSVNATNLFPSSISSSFSKYLTSSSTFVLTVFQSSMGNLNATSSWISVTKLS